MIQHRIITTLADEIGSRPATSTAEARYAAFFAAQMRQANLEVGVQPFSAAAAPTAGLGFLAALGVVASILGWWLPLPSVGLSMLLVLLAVRELRGPPTFAALLRRRPSQNVIGTRAAKQYIRQRIVFLCHLDSPRVVLQPSIRIRLWLLVVPLSLTILVGILSIKIIFPALTPLLLVPMLLLVGSVLVVWRREQTAQWSTGAVDAAAAGTILEMVSGMPVLDTAEIWVVALGAGAASGAGLSALLEVYPFPRQETFFIDVPWLGRGMLTLVTGKGLWKNPQAYSSFMTSFRDTQTAHTQLIPTYRQECLNSCRLQRHGYQAISLVGVDNNGVAAGFRQADDQGKQLNQVHMNLACSLLQQILTQIAEPQR